jgi:hypothetical protein
MSNRLTNPYLQWELTKKLQAGIDLGLFKDHLNFTVNFYRNRSSNQLLQYNLPSVVGFDYIQQNLPATIQNSGWEIAVTGQIVKAKEFTWSSAFNITVPRNKLVAFPNIQNTTYGSNLKVGQPFTIVALYQYMKVNTTTGLYQFADINGNPSTTAGNPTASRINISPRLYGGFQNTFSYKSFDFDIFFQFSKQKGFNYLLGNNPGVSFTNQPTTVLNRFQKPGQETNIQKFYGGDANTTVAFRTAQISDGVVSDASYIRLKNISLSWRLPDPWLRKAHLQNVKLYILGQNIATMTNYIGLDPETRNQKALPPLRIITAGVHIGL